MPDKLWKATERRIAQLFDSKRNSLSGMNSKITGADVIHPDFYIEVKERSRIPFYATFQEVRNNAKKEGKIPMIILHQKSMKDDLVMINLKDFIKLIKRG